MKKLILVASVVCVLSLAVSAHCQDGPHVASTASSSENLPTGLPLGEAVSDSLNALLDRTKVASHKFGPQIAAAVQASPRLAAQLNALVASGKLTDIIVQKGNGRVNGTIFRGAVTGTQIVLTEGLINDVTPHPYSALPGHVEDSTVFVLGHLAYHVQSDADLKSKSDAAATDLFAHPNADGSVDATQFILQSANGNMDVEAHAFFQGWNDMVDAATITKGQALTLSDVGALLANSNYGLYLARSMMQPGGSLKWDPASGYLFATDKNIQIMIATLRNSPVADIQ